MQNHGTFMYGKLFLETVNSLPDWNKNNIGRVLFDKQTSQIWICAENRTIGTDGWIFCGLRNKCIDQNHINWDVELNDCSGVKVHAGHVPCRYKDLYHKCNSDDYYVDELLIDDISTVQKAIDNIRAFVNANIFEINEQSVKFYHLDTTSLERVDTSRIPVRSAKLKFGDANLNLDDALVIVYDKIAKLEASNRLFNSYLERIVTSIENLGEKVNDHTCRIKYIESKFCGISPDAEVCNPIIDDCASICAIPPCCDNVNIELIPNSVD